MIAPDPAAEVHVDFDDGSPAERVFPGDIRNTDDTPRDCCPREFLRRAITARDQAARTTVSRNTAPSWFSSHCLRASPPP